MEAIILAGGLGTRLRSVVQNVPKSMAPIRSRPFLEYQLDLLIEQGIQRFIFSVGYKSDSISNHFGAEYKGCPIDYALEETQLGTGGAIKNAMQYVSGEHVVVINGDSLFRCPIQAQFQQHIASEADVTLALKPMENFQRYGTVQLNKQGRITQFLEKQPVESGIINGGLYIFKVATFRGLDLPEKFSVEKDFFEAKVGELKINGFLSNGYFLDIGIPKDFQKAPFEIVDLPKIDKSWTLFLDRDGVINKKIDNDYVRSIADFELLPGAVEAITNFSNFFGKIIVVTNQQGIGKELMSHRNVQVVHQFLTNEVQQKGGTIDAIFYAPQLASANSAMRKPSIGMALKARNQFPAIDFSKSIMVGDSDSDMVFGRNAGMHTVLIKAESLEVSEQYTIGSLRAFSQLLDGILKKDN